MLLLLLNQCCLPLLLQRPLACGLQVWMLLLLLLVIVAGMT
jgi:hypothetical protein